MSAELSALTLACLLQIVQFILLAIPANLEAGPKRTLSPRDENILQYVSPPTRRLHRALINHVESLVLFGSAVVLVHLTGSASTITAWAAWTYLAARVLYVPAYAFGWVPWRSVIWSVGFVSIAVLLVVPLWTVGITLP